MTLNKFKNYVKKFEKKAGFNKTKIPKLLNMLQEEVNILKKKKNKKKIADHQLTDILILILQLANRYKTNLDLEWKKHWKKSQKYL